MKNFAVFQYLEDMGIERVEISFHGHGGEGFFDEAIFSSKGSRIIPSQEAIQKVRPDLKMVTSTQFGPKFPKEGEPVTTPCSILEALEEIVYEKLRKDHPSWKNKKRAAGCLILQTDTKTIQIDLQRLPN